MTIQKQGDERPNVIFFTNCLTHYRIPILRLVAKEVNLTLVCEYAGEADPAWGFKLIKMAPPRKIGPIVWNREPIYQMAQQYDVAIALGTIKWLKYMLLPWHPRRRFKTIYWGIGVSASLSKHFDAKKQWDWLRDLFFKRAEANIYYTSYPVNKNLKRGYKKEAMFVANNTVEVLPMLPGVKKDSILFIGTLYKAKGIFVLLESYLKAKQRVGQLPILKLIGKGDEEPAVRQWVKVNKLEDCVKLLGPIYDDAQKREHIQAAFACITPYQAGLSVLESMGYGTPFITRDNAITGGEIFNITDNVTGRLLTDDTQFVDVISDIAIHPAKYEQMGKNARKHYEQNRTPQIMANGVIEAIRYVVGK